MKKLLLTLFCVLQINLIFAANAKYDSENYNLSLEYNDVINIAMEYSSTIHIINKQQKKFFFLAII